LGVSTVSPAIDVPGTSRGVESFEEAEQVAGRIGYPVMLKAAAGGGGKGAKG